MPDDDPAKDPVPTQVGSGALTYDIIKTTHLGSGHFGDVYMGKHSQTGQKVAVKLEHRSASTAKREWDVMSLMSGNGAPRVYYTGRHGRYCVMVMDLLGVTLQCHLEKARTRKLPWDTVAVIGLKSVDLLRKLHSKGFVHGDVKPENFMCSYAEGKRAHPRDGLYMVDLGLASRWRDLTRPSGHIAYRQRVDRFSGTVRYASVNAHLGRWLSRRDDLESLAYMMLYLLNGSLPWQGYGEQDKNMKVCETKGRTSVVELCKNAPDVMQFFLAYVRDLRFEETPDYDYLQLLCGTGDRDVRAVQKQITALRDAAPVVAGVKRARSDLHSVEANGKRHRVVAPRAFKTSQWIIVSTSSPVMPFSRQRFSSHTSCENLVRDVERRWASGMLITSLSFAKGRWTTVMNTGLQDLVDQELNCCLDMFPMKWVREKWEDGYFITSVAGNEHGWGLVCSTMVPSRKFSLQAYMVSETFPSKWIADKWDAGFFITAIASQGTSSSYWCVVMSRGTTFEQQCVEMDFQYPSQAIRARWEDGYMITAVACSDDQCAFVMSRGPPVGVGQRCTRISSSPIDKVRRDWQDDMFVTSLSYGRVS